MKGTFVPAAQIVPGWEFTNAPSHQGSQTKPLLFSLDTWDPWASRPRLGTSPRVWAVLQGPELGGHTPYISAICIHHTYQLQLSTLNPSTRRSPIFALNHKSYFLAPKKVKLKQFVYKLFFIKWLFFFLNIRRNLGLPPIIIKEHFHKDSDAVV